MTVRAAAPLRLGVACFLVSLAGSASDAAAQRGIIRGLVIDSAGAPISGVDVRVVAQPILTRTDQNGRFAIRELPQGEVELAVRRLGFQPQSVNVFVTAVRPDSVRVTMRAHVVSLEPVVSATERRKRQGIEDFHWRRERGTGTFFTREDFLARNARYPTDLLRTAPGVRVVRTRSGIPGVRFPTTSIRGRDCMPMVWLDGQRAPGLEIDAVPVHDIEGLELYTGPATTPMQFSQASSSTTCGTIVIWTRNPGG